jgi:hypothetical protein
MEFGFDRDRVVTAMRKKIRFRFLVYAVIAGPQPRGRLVKLRPLILSACSKYLISRSSTISCFMIFYNVF